MGAEEEEKTYEEEKENLPYTSEREWEERKEGKRGEGERGKDGHAVP